MTAKWYRTLQGKLGGRGGLDCGKEHEGGGDQEEGEDLVGEHVGCFFGPEDKDGKKTEMVSI